MGLIQQHGERRDLTAYETRTRLRVTVRPTNHAIYGHLVPRGTHEIEVPDSIVASVFAEVETAADRELLKHAEQRYEQELAKHKGAGHGEGTFGRSVPGEFRKISGRSVPPLTACEVVAKDIAPPLTPEQRQTAGVLAHVAALQSQIAAATETKSKKS